MSSSGRPGPPFALGSLHSAAGADLAEGEPYPGKISNGPNVVISTKTSTSKEVSPEMVRGGRGGTIPVKGPSVDREVDSHPRRSRRCCRT